MHQKDALFGFPLVPGPTLLHTLSGVKVASFNKGIKEQYVRDIRMGLAALLLKNQFLLVSIGILSRLESIVNIILEVDN